MAESTLYAWLKVYREESRGGSRSNGGWIELSRREVKGSKALAVKGGGALAAESPDRVRAKDAPPGPDRAIRVSLNGACVLVPCGCDEATIRSVLSAVASL